jgi:hypothetical protein
MSGGIERVHGKLLAPKNFAGVTLNDFTLNLWTGDAGTTLALDLDTPDGAFDKAFRTAVQTVGSVSRVGTLNTSTKKLNFAMEVLGADPETPGFLGMGPSNGTAGSDSTSTAAALTAAVQALGDVTVPGTSEVVHLSSATVTAFVY